MSYFLLILLFVGTLHSQSLKSSVGYFEQKELTSKANILQKDFTKLEPLHSNFGFSNSIYWLKVDVENLLDKQITEVLHFPYPLLDYIDIYRLADEKLILKREFGDLREYENDSYIPNPSFIIKLQPNESRTYFYKIQTQGSMNINLEIHSDDEFSKYSIEKTVIYSFYFGAIVIMLLYNFLLYLFIKDKSYLYYLLFHIDYLFFSLALNGISISYIWSISPIINSFLVPLLMSIGSTIAVAFTMEFLDIKTFSIKLHKYLKAILWINIMMTLATTVISYHNAAIYATVASVISIISIIYSGVYAHFVFKNPYAKIFVLAWYYSYKSR